MQAVLVMFRSDGERRSFSVVRNMTVIGRREDCDLRIPLGEISRKHCRIVKDADSIRLEDLGSSNGTYHNGLRVEKDVNLGPGDSIQVGPVVFVLQIDGVPADEELHPITADTSAGSAMGATPPPMPSAPSMSHSGSVEHIDELEPLSDEGMPTGLAGGHEDLEPLALDDLDFDSDRPHP